MFKYHICGACENSDGVVRPYSIARVYRLGIGILKKKYYEYFLIRLFCIIRGHISKCIYCHIFLPLKFYLILVNIADTDEITYNAAFNLGLHCLPKLCLQVSRM